MLHCTWTVTMSTIGLKRGAFWPKGLTNYSHLSRACVPLVVGSRAPRLSTSPLFLCRSTLGVWPCLLQWSNCTHMIFSSSCGQLVQNHALLELQSSNERLLSFEQSLINMFLYVHRLESWQKGAWFISQLWRLRMIMIHDVTFCQKLQNPFLLFPSYKNSNCAIQLTVETPKFDSCEGPVMKVNSSMGRTACHQPCGTNTNIPGLSQTSQ